nr:corynanthe C17 O-methyltransferase [Mitragyna speciosa]
MQPQRGRKREREREEMESVQSNSSSSDQFAMKGGDDDFSYTKNSTHQRDAIQATKFFIQESIAEKLDVNKFCGKAFCVADLGCSVGPNTLIAMQNIVEAVELKFKNRKGFHSPTIPEFQVFFNDHTVNDFNTLFRSLPTGHDKRYYGVGVPGSFYGRLFPCDSIHIMHTSFSTPFLSQVPKEVMDKNSAAWNKGRIHHNHAKADVLKAYEAQHAEDIDCFLTARAKELVHGGLLMDVTSFRPDGVPHTHVLTNIGMEVLGYCLMDLAKKGLIDEENVDSYNVPVYLQSPEELKQAVQRNKYFSIEKMESVPMMIDSDVSAKAQQYSLGMRAVMGDVIREQFGAEIVDKLFDLFKKKLEEHPNFAKGVVLDMFVLLKRNAED